MKKLFSVLISCVIIFSTCITPITAFGLETQNTEADKNYVEEFIVNPLIGEYVDEAFCTDVESQKTVYDVTNSLLYEAKDNQCYTTVEAAGAFVRDAMVNREGTIIVKFYKPNIETYASTIPTDIFAEAIKHTGVPVEGDYLAWQYYGYRTMYTYNKATNVITVEYHVYYNTTAEQEAVVDSSVQQLLKDLNLNDKSDYEKVKTIYEYLCGNVTYDYENLNNTEYLLKHTAYAAIENKTAVCQGYAVLFYRLALELNLQARVVVGNNHAWNIVKLDDKYYSVDATWDAPYGFNSARYIYFLKGTDNFKDHVVDTNLTPAEIVNDYNMSKDDYVSKISVSKQNIGIFSVNLEYNSVDYDSTSKTPSVTVGSLIQGKDFEVIYSNNTNPGVATVTIKGKGNYEGTVERQFTINGVDIEENTITNLMGDLEQVRIYGANRYETSLQTADALKKTLGISKFNTIIIADGRNYADALAGAYLAKVKDAPIIVVGNDDKSQEQVAKYVEENLKANGTVYILGGTGAVSASMENSLKQYAVKRLGGKDRFETNMLILKEAGVSSEDILVCSAYGFADSLSASAVGKPILLVGDKLTENQKTYLKQLSQRKYYIIGGTGAVSDTIEKELKSFGNIKRVYGKDRYVTSAEVAKEFFGENSEAVVLAYGLNFPDGLSGGPLAMAMGVPLVLASTDNTGAAADYANNANANKVVVLGGPSLIDDVPVKIIMGAIQGVYRTPSGKQYHFDADCGGKNSYEITWNKIGTLTPCEKCTK